MKEITSWMCEVCGLDNRDKYQDNVINLEEVEEFSDLVPSYSSSSLPALVFANRDLKSCQKDLIQLASIDGILRSRNPELKRLFFEE